VGAGEISSGKKKNPARGEGGPPGVGAEGPIKKGGGRKKKVIGKGPRRGGERLAGERKKS